MAPALDPRRTTRTVTDELRSSAQNFATPFTHGDLLMPPGRQVPIVVCMDARLNVYGLLGLSEGEAHVIRNAGGVSSEHAIRSLANSQRLLGIRPAWAGEAFGGPAADLRQSLRRLAANPFVPYRGQGRGFVYSVADGTLEKITDV